jgi:hypothetical protein
LLVTIRPEIPVAGQEPNKQTLFPKTPGGGMAAGPEDSMHSTRPHGRGRLAAAIVISLSLHALIGLAWFHSRGEQSGTGVNINVHVDGPEDHGVAFVLRDWPADAELKPSPPVTPPTAIVPPQTVPNVLGPPAEAGPGAVTPVSVSPAQPPDLPKFGGARPLHGRPKAGTTVVYVLDRSASMGPDALLIRAANVLRASLAELGPDTRFQIVAYNGGTMTLAPRPLAATAEAKDRADHWLANLTAEGGSNHRSGFREAMAAKPDQLFLLTDADDLEESDVRAIAALIRTPVRLSAAVFAGHRPAAVTPLERLVGRFDGSVQYVEP